MGKKNDLAGQRFGYLIAERENGRSKNGNILWFCACDCGGRVTASADALRFNKKRDCGCRNLRKVHDREMIGQKFGRLLIIRRALPDGDQARWECLCDCGNVVTVRGGPLRGGHTRSCGCKNATTHGMSKTSLYRNWSDMKRRCLDPKNKAYSYYGGRGITVCSPWRRSFEEFYRDVGDKPGPEYTLDRIDSDGNYEPNNIRWATPQEQRDNKKFRSLSFNTYQNSTRKTAIYPKNTAQEAVLYCALGVSGESGEICNKVAKLIRDRGYEMSADFRKGVAKEIGDCLWFLSELSSSLGFKLDQIARDNLTKLQSRFSRGVIKGDGDNR